MRTSLLLAQARSAAGLSQQELARRAGTSRPTLSAYENGRKSPTLATAERLLAVAGFELVAWPRLEFTEYPVSHGRTVWVPDRLPRLSVERAFMTVVLPLHLDWSKPGRSSDLASRTQRARVYEIVLREGQPDDILRYVDGVLLVDQWSELVLPRPVRAAWESVIGVAGVAA